MQFGDLDSIGDAASSGAKQTVNQPDMISQLNQYMAEYYASLGQMGKMSLPSLTMLGNTQPDSVQRQNKGGGLLKAVTSQGKQPGGQSQAQDQGPSLNGFMQRIKDLQTIPVRLQNLAHPLLAMFQTAQDGAKAAANSPTGASAPATPSPTTSDTPVQESAPSGGADISGGP